MKIRFKRLFAVILAGLMLSGCGGNTSDINKIDPPTQSELKSADMENIEQTDEFGDYVLTDYDIEQKKIVYSFTDKESPKKSLAVTGRKMTPEEYNSSLPETDTLKDAVINGINCKFIDRTVHFVPDGYMPDDRVKRNVAMGTTEIKYGNPNDLDELLPLQRFYWYDDALGIGYEIEATGQYYTLEEMSIYVQNYVESAE